MNQKNGPAGSGEGWNVLDENIAGLLRQAYEPAQPEAGFEADTRRRMLEAARERAARPSGRRVAAWGLVAMAAAAAMVVGVGAAVVYMAGRIKVPAPAPMVVVPGEGRRGDAETRRRGDGGGEGRRGGRIGVWTMLKAMMGAEGTPAVVKTPGPGPREPVRAWERLTAMAGPAGLPADRGVVGTTVRTGPTARRRVAMPDGSVLYMDRGTSVELKGRREVSLTAGRVYLEVQTDAKGEAFVVRTPGREVRALGTRLAVEVAGGTTGVWVTQGTVAVSGVDAPLYAGEQLDPRGGVGAMPRATAVLDWTRELVGAASGALVPASRHAGGALTATEPGGREFRLELRKYHVDVHVEDGFARTTIDQTYFNHTGGRLEGTFWFPLPADASLSRLAMYVAGVRMEGGMAEREEALRVYESIVQRMQDPALLEWVDGTTFKMRVFPLEGRQEKRIILSYTQKLPGLYDRATYRFPAGHSLGAVADWSLNLRVKGGQGAAWECSSHELAARTEGGDLVLTGQAKDSPMDRDVVVGLREAAGRAGTRVSTFEQEGQRYLMVRHRPELPTTARREKREWVFLFESSADRDPLLARAQVEVVRGMLEAAEHADTFNVVTAGTRARVLWKKPAAATRENVAEAVTFLEGTHLVGALDLEGALAAVQGARGGGRKHLVHVGSGNAVLGVRDRNELVRKMPGECVYVGIGVGKRWDRAWMKEAAARTGGYVTQINPDENVRWRAMDVMAALKGPRLLEVSATAGDTPMLCGADAASAGEEVWAVARVGADKPLPAEVTLRGQLDGKEFCRRVSTAGAAGGAGYLPRTWAKLEIDRLLAAGAEVNRGKVVELSKAMYVMSPYTSLLVLENEAMYRQHNVDRGRKDHWAMYECPEKIAVVTEPWPPVAVPAVRSPAAPTAQEEYNLAMAMGKASLAEGDGAKAEAYFLVGLKLRPADEQARLHLDTARALQERTAGPSPEGQLLRMRRVAWMATVVEMERAMERSRRAARDPQREVDFDQAMKEAAVAQSLLAENKGYCDSAAELRAWEGKVRDRVRDIELRKAEWVREQAKLAVQPSASSERDRIARMERARAQQVDELTRRAKTMLAEQQYEGAVQTLTEITRLNPQDRWAAYYLETAKREVELRRQRETMVEESEQGSATFQDIRKSEIPWYLEITYPGDWRERTLRRKGGPGSGEGGYDKNGLTQQKLQSTIIRAEFEGQELGFVIDYMRETTELPIHVKWRTLAGAGVTAKTPVTLRLRNVAVEKALQVLLDDLGGAELAYTIDEGVVTISTAADIRAAATRPGAASDAMAAAGRMMNEALDAAGRDQQDRPAMAAAAHYVQARRWDLADRQLEGLLADSQCGRNAKLWRAASMVAAVRGLTGVSVRRLARALEMEDREGRVRDLREVRADYGRLLAGYQAMAKAVAGMRPASAEVAAGVIGAADRWRVLDPDVTAACRMAAEALATLGAQEEAWEYLTTPLADATKGAWVWRSLAGELGRQGQMELAVRAYAAAARMEPGDPRILWEHAELLRDAGRAGEAKVLYGRIAERDWGAKYAPVRERARGRMGG